MKHYLCFFLFFQIKMFKMVTIQTMIDHEDEDSDEVIPVPTVKAQVLDQCFDQ